MKIGMWNKGLLPGKRRASISSSRNLFLCIILGVVLTGCGGGGPDNPDEDGPIIVGTGVTERALARLELEVKSASGEISEIPITSAGSFNAGVEGDGPYLSRLDLGNDEFLYSIGYADTNLTVKQNVHSYSDVVVRNWFASRGRNIDAEFANTEPTSMPPENEIDIILQRIVSIVALVMQDYDVAGSDLFTDTASTPLNTFILQNPVIIINNIVTIIVNDDPSGNGTQSVATDDLDLDTDLSLPDTQSPTAPGDLRAIAASATEIVLVWTPSTDNIGVTGYQIFRDGVDVGLTPYPVFTDTVATGLSPVYSVIAVDASDNESLPSAEVIGMTETVIDTDAPPTPQAVVLTPTISSVNVSWQQTDIADVAGFRVLAALAGDPVALRATVTSTFMTDSDVDSGLEYCYQVVAVDASGNESAPTQMQCVTVGGSVVIGTEPPNSSRDTQISFSAATYSVTENSPSVELEVLRSGAGTAEVTVDYSVASGTAIDGEDFTATSGTLRWSEGQMTPRRFTVQIASDIDNTEGAETFTVSLSNLSSNATFGANSSATVTINDVASAECNTVLVTTTITADTSLNLPCYLVNDDLDVREPAQLTIQPGVMLKFAAGQQLVVRNGASLTAVGTAANPIVLTAQDPSPGFWEGVYFLQSNSSRNDLNHVVIEYGGSSPLDSNLRIQGSRASVANTTLRHSAEYGFRIDSTSTIVAFDSVTSTSNIVAGVTGPIQASSITSSGSFTGNDADVIEVLDNNIDEDTTWVNVGVPWLADGVDVRASWTVESGTEIEFVPGTELIVRSDGQATIRGTEQAPVLLTGQEKTPGSWQGVFLLNADGANTTLTNAIIEFAGSSTQQANFYTLNNSRFGLDNVILRNGSGYGFNIGTNAVISQFSNVTSVDNLASGTIVANLVGAIDTGVNLTGNANDALTLSNDLVDSAQTWPAVGVPVIHEGLDIRDALTVSAGTTLVATADSEIIVREGGSLRSAGTAADNVVFTSQQPIKGFWRGINFIFSNNVSNVFEFTVVEYGGFGDQSGNLRSLCIVTPVPVYTIENSNLDNSGGFGQFIGNNCVVVIGDNVTYMGNVEGPTNLP